MNPNNLDSSEYIFYLKHAECPTYFKHFYVASTWKMCERQCQKIYFISNEFFILLWMSREKKYMVDYDSVSCSHACECRNLNYILNYNKWLRKILNMCEKYVYLFI